MSYELFGDLASLVAVFSTIGIIARNKKAPAFSGAFGFMGG